MSNDFPFIDLRAADSLTVRLKLVSPTAMSLSVYWGGDPTHTLGTDDAFRWDGRWSGRSRCPSTMVSASDEDIVMEIMRKLVWHDLAEKTLADFKASGVVESVVRDAAEHHLVLTVMGS
jgi:hypothetical protein